MHHQGGQLLLFGGWANRWFSDGFTLDVGSLVGPPYAVVDVTPDHGPITGETLLQVYGIDFINTDDVTVSIPSVFSVKGFRCFALHILGLLDVMIERLGLGLPLKAQCNKQQAVSNKQTDRSSLEIRGLHGKLTFAFVSH